MQRSWTELGRRRLRFLDQLEAALSLVVGPATAAHHARLMLAAADDLVHLLGTPSQLAARVAAISEGWPVSALRPHLDLDGAAWRRAASKICTGWTDEDEAAWRRAWLLLADVVAEIGSTPFDDGVTRHSLADDVLAATGT